MTAKRTTNAKSTPNQTAPTPDRPDVPSDAFQSATPRKSASQPANSAPSPTSAAGQKKHRACMARHQRKCAVCHHPQRKEIEQDYLRWRSPSEIAREYGLADHRPIYRHMHATGIFARRRNKLRLALDPLIERVMDVKVTAHAILKAIATSDSLAGSRKWIGRPGVRNVRGVNRFARPEINAAIADEVEGISNRESSELEPDATR
jgi:hypothetical protein